MLNKIEVLNNTVPSSEEFINAKTGYPAAEKQPSTKIFPGFSDNWQDRYSDNRLVLMIRDPYWCFAYWDLTEENKMEIIQKTQMREAKLILRAYDITGIAFDGNNAHKTMDIEISEETGNWYINVGVADCSYCVDIGLLYANGHFVTIIRSNIVVTPRDSISNVIDEEWMMFDEVFAKLYRIAGAGELGPASEVFTKSLLRSERAEATSGGLAGLGVEGGKTGLLRTNQVWRVVKLADALIF